MTEVPLYERGTPVSRMDGRSIHSTSLYQMLLKNEQYDLGVQVSRVFIMNTRPDEIPGRDVLRQAIPCRGTSPIRNRP